MCDIHGSYDQPYEYGDEEHHENGQIDHRLLQCRGCETAFYWRSSWDTQDYEHYYNRRTGAEEVGVTVKVETFPVPEKSSTRPDWTWSLYKTDAQLSQIMGEVYQTVEQNAFILASVGLRTALDRIAELLGIDPAISMAEKIKALQAGGWIGETEAQTLSVVAEAGHAAAHRGWSPDKDDFKPLLETLEQFMHRAILSGKGALEIAGKIPAKPSRRQSR